jgi:hypothetical protein
MEVSEKEFTFNSAGRVVINYFVSFTEHCFSLSIDGDDFSKKKKKKGR